MTAMKLLWRDPDRLPYLFTLSQAASKHGVDLAIEPGRGREYGDLLLGGQCEFLAENYWNLQSFKARGEPIIAIATAVTVRNEKLLARQGIDSLDDLRGKKLGIRGMRPTDLIDPLWVRDAGLEGDVEVVLVPESETGRWGVWKKVVAGEVDAAFVTNLYVDEALAAGLHEIPTEPYGFLGNAVLTTTRQIIETRRGEVEAVVRAAFDTVTMFANEPDTVQGIMTSRIPPDLMKPPYASLETPQQVKRVYEIIRDELADPPVPTPEAIANFRRMTLPALSDLAGYNPLLMWDFSFASAIADERKKAS